jgi:phage terminase small subunit
LFLALVQLRGLAGGEGVMALSAKHQAFINEYFKCRFNATRAYIAAGYSEKGAAPSASKLLRNPNIQEAIEKRLKEEALTADQALHLLKDHATGDITEFMDATGYVDVAAIQASGKTHLIREWEQWEYVDADGEKKEGRVKIKLHDAQSALKEIIKLYRLDHGQSTENTTITLINSGMNVDDL